MMPKLLTRGVAVFVALCLIADAGSAASWVTSTNIQAPTITRSLLPLFNETALQLRLSQVPSRLTEEVTAPIDQLTAAQMSSPSFAMLIKPSPLATLKRLAAGIAFLTLASFLSTIILAAKKIPVPQLPPYATAAHADLSLRLIPISKLTQQRISARVTPKKDDSTSSSQIVSKNRNGLATKDTRELFYAVAANDFNDAIRYSVKEDKSSNTYFEYFTIKVPNPAKLKSMSFILRDDHLEVREVEITGTNLHLTLRKDTGDIYQSSYEGDVERLKGLAVTTVKPHFDPLQNEAILQFAITIQGPHTNVLTPHNVIAFVQCLYDTEYNAVLAQIRGNPASQAHDKKEHSMHGPTNRSNTTKRLAPSDRNPRATLRIPRTTWQLFKQALWAKTQDERYLEILTAVKKRHFASVRTDEQGQKQYELLIDEDEKNGPIAYQALMEAFNRQNGWTSQNPEHRNLYFYNDPQDPRYVQSVDRLRAYIIAHEQAHFPITPELVSRVRRHIERALGVTLTPAHPLIHAMELLYGDIHYNAEVTAMMSNDQKMDWWIEELIAQRTQPKNALHDSEKVMDELMAQNAFLSPDSHAHESLSPEMAAKVDQVIMDYAAPLKHQSEIIHGQLSATTVLYEVRVKGIRPESPSDIQTFQIEKEVDPKTKVALPLTALDLIRELNLRGFDLSNRELTQGNDRIEDLHSPIMGRLPIEIKPLPVSDPLLSPETLENWRLEGMLVAYGNYRGFIREIREVNDNRRREIVFEDLNGDAIHLPYSGFLPLIPYGKAPKSLSSTEHRVIRQTAGSMAASLEMEDQNARATITDLLARFLLDLATTKPRGMGEVPSYLLNRHLEIFKESKLGLFRETKWSNILINTARAYDHTLATTDQSNNNHFVRSSLLWNMMIGAVLAGLAGLDVHAQQVWQHTTRVAPTIIQPAQMHSDLLRDVLYTPMAFVSGLLTLFSLYLVQKLGDWAGRLLYWVIPARSLLAAEYLAESA